MKLFHNKRKSYVYVYYFWGREIRLKPYSQYSVHLWPSTIFNLKDRQLIHWGIHGHQCMLMGRLPGPAVSHHTTYLHNTVTMCVLDTPASLSLAVFLALLPVSVLLSFLRLACMWMFEHKRVHLNSHIHKRVHTHTHSRSRACSSWVFCGLDSHRCFLWLHYCYLNVGGRSAASINGILSTVDEAQDTHTYTHKSIHA